MERGVYLKKMQGGLKEWPGVQIIFNATRIGGTLVELVRRACSNAAASRPRTSSASRTSTTKFEQVSDIVSTATSARSWPRRSSATILENYYFVPVFRHAFVNAIGPRITAQKWQDVFPTITTGYAYPWEDIELKETVGAVTRTAEGAAMTQFIIRRTLYALVTLFILSLTIFMVVRLTGDPVTLLAEPGARAEDLDRVRAEWGLDRPWPVQYVGVRQEYLHRRSRQVVQLRDAGQHAVFPAPAEFAGAGARRDADLVRDRHPGRAHLGGARSTAPGTMSARSSRCSAWRCPASGSGWC